MRGSVSSARGCGARRTGACASSRRGTLAIFSGTTGDVGKGGRPLAVHRSTTHGGFRRAARRRKLLTYGKRRTIYKAMGEKKLSELLAAFEGQGALPQKVGWRRGVLDEGDRRRRVTFVGTTGPECEYPIKSFLKEFERLT